MNSTSVKETSQKEWYKKPVVIACCVLTLLSGCTCGGLWLWNQNASSPAGTDLQSSTTKDSSSKSDGKTSTDSDKSSLVFELGSPVTLDVSTFLPEENPEDWTLDCELIQNNGYTYNQATRQVVTKNKKYLAKGTYTVKLTQKKTGQVRTLRFTVKDTKAPEFTGFAERISIEQNAQNVRLESYWSAADLDSVVISVSGKVDYSKVGEYPVRVTAVDVSGNKTEKKAVVRIVDSAALRSGQASLTVNAHGEVALSEQTRNLASKGQLSEPNTSLADTQQNDQNIQQQQQQAWQQYQNEIQHAAELEALKQNQNGWYENGEVYMVHGNPATGLQTIDGQVYLFNASGFKLRGWQILNGKRYYFHPDTGAMVTGAITIENEQYWLNEDGSMLTGWRSSETGDVYYYGKDGRQRFGEILIDGERYYLDVNGRRYSGFRLKTMADGSSVTTYYDADGILAHGEQTIEGKTYHFDSFTGAMDTGLIQIAQTTGEDGATKTVFMAEDGTMQYGFIDLDGQTYYFDQAQGGAMQFGQKQIGSDTYCFDSDTGAMQTGWQDGTEGVRYFDASKGGAMATGFQTIEGAQYFFDENGLRQSGLQTINKEVHYFEPATGKGVCSQIVRINSHIWYFNARGVQDTGLIEQDGSLYYFDPETGEMVTDQKLTLNGADYYFGEDGAAIRSGFVIRDGQKTYVAEDGTSNHTGWLNLTSGSDKGKYYLENGHPLMDTLMDLEGKTYGFDKDGRLLSGSQTVDGYSVVFESGGFVRPGWYNTHGKTLYCTQNNLLMRGQATQSHQIDEFYDITMDASANITRIIPKNVAKFNQRSYTNYGDGDYMCVPTSLGVGISFFNRWNNGGANRDDMPYIIRNELLAANLYTAGAGSYNPSGAAEYAPRQHGLTSAIIGNSADALRSQLKNGAFIMIVTISKPYVADGKTPHAMALYGYEPNGDKVYVHDPYSPELCGWKTMAEITGALSAQANHQAVAYNNH